MTVIAPPGGALEYRHAGVLSRLRSFVRGDVLDHALAAGVTPESSVLLAVHAQRIVRPRACRALAATLRRLVNGRIPGSSAPVSRARVQREAARLEAVAARLEVNGPIGARGVADLRVLLSEASGPLYDTGGKDLDRQLARILAELEPA
jgi:hypothetical protein